VRWSDCESFRGSSPAPMQPPTQPATALCASAAADAHICRGCKPIRLRRVCEASPPHVGRATRLACARVGISLDAHYLASRRKSGRWWRPEKPRKQRPLVKVRKLSGIWDSGVLKVWQAGVATAAVALLSSALIVLDLSDGRFDAGVRLGPSAPMPLREFWSY
jgi:hypothetical protein